MIGFDAIESPTGLLSRLGRRKRQIGRFVRNQRPEIGPLGYRVGQLFDYTSDPGYDLKLPTPSDFVYSILALMILRR